LILPKFSRRAQHTSPAATNALKTHASARSAAENCARVIDLGFTASKHITMYGERFDLISDPFVEGDFTTVYAISRNDPEVRELRLPVSILVGLPDLLRPRAKVPRQETS
jgi:hypothetical protein